MSDSVESRVREAQKGNKQNKIILKFVGLAEAISSWESGEESYMIGNRRTRGRGTISIVMELAWAAVD